MLVLPLLATPNQTFEAVLDQQQCTIKVYQKSTGLFLDLYSNGRYVVQGAICRDRCLIVRLAYLGFIGDLSFFDTQGTSDPDYTGLADRFVLAYLSKDET